MNKWLTVLSVGALALGITACSKQPAFGDQNSGGSGSGYPEKPITIVAPSGAGGGWDQTARSIATTLQKTKLVEKPITVENRPGGGGAVFMAEFANGLKNDPYKLMVKSPPILINHLKKEGNSPFGYQDTTPLAQLTIDYGAYVVRNDSPIKDLPGFIEELKKDPKKFTIAGGSSPGSMDHLISILPAYKSGIQPSQLKYVSYDGSGEAMTALLGNNADIIATDLSSVMEYVKSGKVRVLAITAPQKLTGIFSNVPTLRDLGYQDTDFVIWRGVFGPKGLSAEQKKYWDDKFKALSEHPEWKAEVEKKGWTLEYKDSTAFTDFLAKQEQQVKELLTSLGMNK